MVDKTNKFLRLDRWERGEKAPPYEIEFRPTDRCNLRCLTCLARRQWFVAENELTEAECLSLVAQAAALGVEHIILSGGRGEPLMRWTMLHRMMLEIKRLGMRGNLVTNGTLFDAEGIRDLVKAGWDQVMFSIDGPTVGLNDRLRGAEGAFEKSAGHLRSFARWKELQGTRKPELVICPVISRANSELLDRFVDLAPDLGANQILFQPVNIVDSSIGGDLILLEEDTQRCLESLRRARTHADEVGIRTNAESVEGIYERGNESPEDLVKEEMTRSMAGLPSWEDVPLSKLPCTSPWSFMAIYADGQVHPCGADDSIEFGNVREAGLEEIWYGEAFDRRRRLLRSGRFPDCCRLCCAQAILTRREEQATLKEGAGK